MNLIDKSALVAEIEKRKNLCEKIVLDLRTKENKDYYQGKAVAYSEMTELIDTLEVKDPYITCIQYTNREAAIKAHAEDYSFNIESALFNQLTKEQQKLWRKEIEQACISGGYSGLNLAKDPRYKENLEVKEMQEKTESIWHDANQQPTMYRKYLVRYSDGRVSGSWERHDNGFIPWKDVVKEHGFTHWCYVEDLIKL